MNKLLLLPTLFCLLNLPMFAQYGLDVDGQVNFERMDNFTQRVRIITQGVNAESLLQLGAGGGVGAILGWDGQNDNLELLPGLVLNNTGFNMKKEDNPNNNSSSVNFGFGTKTNPEDKVVIATNSELGFPTLNLRENETSDYARLQFSGNAFDNQWTIAAGVESAEIGPLMHFIHRSDGNASASRLLTIDGDHKRLGVWDHNPDRSLSINHASITASIWTDDKGLSLKNIGTAEGGSDDYEWLFYIKGDEFTSGMGDLLLLSSHFDGSNYSRGAFDGETGVYTSLSDKRLKKNIKYLNKEKKAILSKIQRLKPASYQFKHQRSNESHLGLIAQEVQQVFPEAVHSLAEDTDKELLGISYTSLVPVLIAGMQAQQADLLAKETAIQSLQEELSELKVAMNAIKALLTEKGKQDNAGTNLTKPSMLLQSDYLAQNAPNPFDAMTTIRYQLPENTNNAFLRITDMQGNLVKEIALENQGQGAIALNKGTLAAGVYTYSLVVNGQLMDVKKMVLTK